jgi:hypothetical protein
MSQHDIVISNIDHIVREVDQKVLYILVHNLTYKSTVT